jgi:hypothetical protein
MISFKQFVTEQFDNNVLQFFKLEDLTTFRKVKWKSRDKLIMMPIDLFLSLAAEGKDPDKEQRVLDMIAQHKQFDLPFLDIDFTNDQQSIPKVVGHEGRHRARALQRLGYNDIPVLIKSDMMRWSEQTNPNAFDYRQIWPTNIISQKGTTLPFFISREQSDKDFPY